MKKVRSDLWEMGDFIIEIDRTSQLEIHSYIESPFSDR